MPSRIIRMRRYAAHMLLCSVAFVAGSCYQSRGTGWHDSSSDASRDFLRDTDDELVDVSDPTYPEAEIDNFADVHDIQIDFDFDTEGVVPCEQVMAESHYCITFVGIDSPLVALVGLDTGSLCLKCGASIYTHYVNSIGWIDPHVYLCTSTLAPTHIDGVARISLIDGALEIVPKVCGEVTTYGNGILVLPESPGDLLDFYESFEAVVSTHHEIISPFSMFARMAVQGDMLYTASHATDEIDVYMLPSGQDIGTIQLEDFDGWINGISVTSDGLLALIGDAPDVRVAVFDAETGRSLWNVYPAAYIFESFMRGLYCMTGE